MAKRDGTSRTSSPPTSNKNRFSSDIAWVNYSLTDEHKKALDKLLDEEPELLELEFAQAAQEGYRWSMTWDTYAGCYSVTMFTREVERPNLGLMMSSRAKSWYKALMMCVYKHVLVFEHRWIVAPEVERDWEG